MDTTEFHFSPSLNHQYLMQQLTPAYTFHGESGTRWPNLNFWQKELRGKLRHIVDQQDEIVQFPECSDGYP
jgi:hypothetical protein